MKIVTFTLFFVGALFPLLSLSETVWFSGHVVQKTCDIAVTGNTSGSVVLLPTASVSHLSRLGKTADGTIFSMGIKNCGTKEQQASERYIAEIITSKTNISNLAGTASNIELQLAVADKSFKTLSSSEDNVYSSDVRLDPEGKRSIPFVVKYYAAANDVVPGSVITSTSFLIVYN